MSKQLFNGQLLEAAETPISTTNRGFCFGDGFFESMRINHGSLLFGELHWQRVMYACKVLQLNIPSTLNEGRFKKYAEQLAHVNGQPNARIRFQAYRAGEGRYTPDTNDLDWCMVSQPIEEDAFTLNPKGLTIGFCRTITINPPPQSTFKSSNSIPYVLATLENRKSGWDDCLLSDAQGFIAEASSSNVFLVHGHRLVTPDLSHGGVSGVMRSVVLNAASRLGLRTEKVLMTEEDVLAADECFLTNATTGIRWVAAVGKKRFYKRTASALVTQINTTYGLS